MTKSPTTLSVRALVGSVLALCSACGCPTGPESSPDNPTITLSSEEYSMAGNSEEVCEVCEGSAKEAALLDAGYFASEIDVDCMVSENTDGSATVACVISASCDAGRAPRSLSEAPHEEHGNWWAGMARREAEAVTAFEELARELTALGAPAELISRAEAARDDELRHAQICARLAGIDVPSPPTSKSHPCDPGAFAALNASEGCIRETFAVVDALARAKLVSNPEAKAALQAIANDELRHAQLSWDIDAWARNHLGSHAHACAASAKRRATRQLLARAEHPEADDGPVRLPRALKRALVQRFVAQLAA